VIIADVCPHFALATLALLLWPIVALAIAGPGQTEDQVSRLRPLNDLNFHRGRLLDASFPVLSLTGHAAAAGIGGFARP